MADVLLGCILVVLMALLVVLCVIGRSLVRYMEMMRDVISVTNAIGTIWSMHISKIFQHTAEIGAVLKVWEKERRDE